MGRIQSDFDLLAQDMHPAPAVCLADVGMKLIDTTIYHFRD